MEGQTPIATQGNDMILPYDTDAIHGDVHDRVERDGPTQDPPSITATPVLQDTFVTPYSMEFLGNTSHLANRPSMTVDEQKMTRTSVICDQEPIHAPASRSTIRGRGKGGGRGMGRIATPMEGQGPIVTQGHDLTVPHDVDVIHRDIQDRVERDRPAQDPPSASRYLGSIIRVVVQTPDTIVAPDSQTPKTQLAAIGFSNFVSDVPFQKVVDAAKELEMIQCEGFEQREGKRAHHS
ncbi:hypothetical protein H5410_060197, partial [Solanum commersonii]